MPLRRSLLARWLPDHVCFWIVALLILSAAVWHVTYLASGGSLDLSPDEAHYWDWSRHLDWSYYSKGPLVAWLIRLSCELTGSWSERLTGSLTLAVRLPAVICGSLLLVSIYLLTVQVFQNPRLGLAVVAGALTLPVLTAGSFLMTIDSPYTCCWGWALVFAHLAIVHRTVGAWEATGLMIGLGFLAKYTMIVFPVSLILFLLVSPTRRHLLISAGFGSMTGIALLCCLPILVWNAQHDWVTFFHVQRLAGLSAQEQSLRAGSFHWLGPWIYLGGQAALMLGYWFVVWLVAMIAWNPLRQQDEGIRFLWWFSAPVFLLFLAFSFKTKGGELNWPVTAYLSGGVLSAAWLAEQFFSPRLWYRRATAVGVVTTLLIGWTLTMVLHRSHWVHPLIDRVIGPPTAGTPFPVRKLDPTCRLRGWRYLAQHVDELRDQLRETEGADPVLAGVSWSLPGELGVYCQGHPQAYSIGLVQGDRRSQYDFWTNPIDQPEEFLGKTFIIVGPISERVAQGFESVEPPREIIYKEDDRPLAGWFVYVCRGFRGFPPPERDPAH